MNTLDDLRAALAELDRRGSGVSFEHEMPLPRDSAPTARPRPRTSRRWAPLSAVVAVAAVAIGIVVAGTGTGSGTGPSAESGDSVATAPTSSGTSPATPGTSATQSTLFPPAPLVPVEPGRYEPPMTQGELTTRFAEALGPAAAIAITGGQDAEGRVFACRTDVSRPAGDLITYGPCEGEPPGVYGASIAGVVSIEGRSGGFNLWVNELTPDEPLPWCRAGTSGTVCDADTTVLSDGSTLATQVSGPLEGGGVSYWAMVHRPNGADIELVISNRASPKGMGATLGAEPPLTMEQLVQVVLSPAW